VKLTNHSRLFFSWPFNKPLIINQKLDAGNCSISINLSRQILFLISDFWLIAYYRMAIIFDCDWLIFYDLRCFNFYCKPRIIFSWGYKTRREWETPHNKRNREQRTENRNFNLSEIMYCGIQSFLIDWNSLFSVLCSFYCTEYNVMCP